MTTHAKSRAYRLLAARREDRNARQRKFAYKIGPTGKKYRILDIVGNPGFGEELKRAGIDVSWKNRADCA